MEGRQRQRGGATLGRAYDAVSVSSETLVGCQPVRQLVGQKRLPLLAAVGLPIRVKAPSATGRRRHGDPLARERVERTRATQLLTSVPPLNASSSTTL
jgi:hypothetical protein